MVPHEEEFATDMLGWADEIALYLFGDREQRRKIYHLVANSRLPVFKLVRIGDRRPPLGPPQMGPGSRRAPSR
jgi:hypothetical protein